MKRTFIASAFILGLIIGCGSGGGGTAAAIAEVVQRLTGAYDGPYEFIVENLSSGTGAITELRALNDVGCAMDVGTTGSNWATDLSLLPNEAFVVSESTCGGMTLKHNADGRIAFSLGASPVEVASFNSDGQLTLRPVNCGASIPTGAGIALCVTDAGKLVAVKADGSVTVLVP